MDIPITFAIITDGSVDSRIEEIITSIEANAIPIYEVLIVGGLTSTINRPNTRHISFDEASRGGWITGKKNIANREATHDVIVFLHDYHVFASDWYQGVVEQGPDFDIQMHRIEMITGHRMFDWLIFDHPELPVHMPIPYERHDLIPHQYISGGYWMSRRHVLLDEPLDENLGHHQSEDVEWSKRVRNKYKIVMNPRCLVKHNKVHRECSYVVMRENNYVPYHRYFQ